MMELAARQSQDILISSTPSRTTRESQEQKGTEVQQEDDKSKHLVNLTGQKRRRLAKIGCSKRKAARQRASHFHCEAPSSPEEQSMDKNGALPGHKEHSNMQRKGSETGDGMNPASCSQCQGTFPSQQDLTKHLRFSYCGKLSFFCELCNKSFTHSSSYSSHLKLHVADRPHLCEFCGKTFRVSSHLKDHVRIHTGERPYICDVCKKSFKQSSDMKKHHKTHNKNRLPYMCHLCQEGYRRMHQLKEHLHSVHNHFKCEQCNTVFESWDIFHQHLQDNLKVPGGCGRFMRQTNASPHENVEQSPHSGTPSPQYSTSSDNSSTKSASPHDNSVTRQSESPQKHASSHEHSILQESSKSYDYALTHKNASAVNGGSHSEHALLPKRKYPHEHSTPHQKNISPKNYSPLPRTGASPNKHSRQTVSPEKLCEQEPCTKATVQLASLVTQALSQRTSSHCPIGEVKKQPSEPKLIFKNGYQASGNGVLSFDSKVSAVLQNKHHKCQLCAQDFGSFDALCKHQLENECKKKQSKDSTEGVSYESGVVSCNFCSREFDSANQLLTHFRVSVSTPDGCCKPVPEDASKQRNASTATKSTESDTIGKTVQEYGNNAACNGFVNNEECTRTTEIKREPMSPCDASLQQDAEYNDTDRQCMEAQTINTSNAARSTAFTQVSSQSAFSEVASTSNCYRQEVHPKYASSAGMPDGHIIHPCHFIPGSMAYPRPSPSVAGIHPMLYWQGENQFQMLRASRNAPRIYSPTEVSSQHALPLNAVHPNADTPSNDVKASIDQTPPAPPVSEKSLRYPDAHPRLRKFPINLVQQKHTPEISLKTLNNSLQRNEVLNIVKKSSVMDIVKDILTCSDSTSQTLVININPQPTQLLQKEAPVLVINYVCSIPNSPEKSDINYDENVCKTGEANDQFRPREIHNGMQPASENHDEIRPQESIQNEEISCHADVLQQKVHSHGRSSSDPGVSLYNDAEKTNESTESTKSSLKCLDSMDKEVHYQQTMRPNVYYNEFPDRNPLKRSDHEYDSYRRGNGLIAREGHFPSSQNSYEEHGKSYQELMRYQMSQNDTGEQCTSMRGVSYQDGTMEMDTSKKYFPHHTSQGQLHDKNTAFPMDSQDICMREFVSERGKAHGQWRDAYYGSYPTSSAYPGIQVPSVGHIQGYRMGMGNSSSYAGHSVTHAGYCLPHTRQLSPPQGQEGKPTPPQGYCSSQQERISPHQRHRYEEHDASPSQEHNSPQQRYDSIKQGNSPNPPPLRSHQSPPPLRSHQSKEMLTPPPLRSNQSKEMVTTQGDLSPKENDSSCNETSPGLRTSPSSSPTPLSNSSLGSVICHVSTNGVVRKIDSASDSLRNSPEQDKYDSSDTGRHQNISLSEQVNENEKSQSDAEESRRADDGEDMSSIRTRRSTRLSSKVDSSFNGRYKEIAPKPLDGSEPAGPQEVHPTFPCGKCARIFYTQEGLTVHAEQHEKKPFTCETCKKSFGRSNLLKQHEMVHMGNSRFKFSCEHCGRKFRNRSHLRDHIRIHTGERPFKCHICSKAFKQSSDLKKHVNLHTGAIPFKCDLCQAVFRRSDALKKHAVSHQLDVKYQCDHCQKHFLQMTKLSQHIITEHIQVNGKFKENEPEHDKTTQNMDKQGKQSSRECSEQSKQKQAISTNFMCHICSRVFNQETSLKDHEGIEHGVKSYKCPDCSHEMFRICELKEHLIMEHKSDHLCDICCKKCSNASELIKHLLIHVD